MSKYIQNWLQPTLHSSSYIFLHLMTSFWSIQQGYRFCKEFKIFLLNSLFRQLQAIMESLFAIIRSMMINLYRFLTTFLEFIIQSIAVQETITRQLTLIWAIKKESHFIFQKELYVNDFHKLI